MMTLPSCSSQEAHEFDVFDLVKQFEAVLLKHFPESKKKPSRQLPHWLAVELKV
jgi:hypothetical protein